MVAALGSVFGDGGLAIAAVRASASSEIVKLAFEFAILTVARSGKARGAPWTEFNEEGRLALPLLQYSSTSTSITPRG
jgi:hypothetical protein